MKHKYIRKHWWWYILPPKDFLIDQTVLELSLYNLENYKVSEKLLQEFIEKYYKKTPSKDY